MSFSVELKNGHSLRVRDINLQAELNSNEVRFSYQGLSNDPISSGYVLAITEFTFAYNAVLLADGFQMCAQTTGTVQNPEDVGRHSEQSQYYRIYSPSASKRYYNYLLVEEDAAYTLFGFTSCHRFAGYFELVELENHHWVKICLDGEETCPRDWSSSQLESIVILKGDSLSQLYHEYTHLISCNHSPRQGVKRNAPIGWCSWYAYYSNVSEQLVSDNLNHMEGSLEAIEYVMIDDGHQAFMGDWLAPSSQFPSGIKSLAQEIKRCGKKPAIWLAPFIVQAESDIFCNHKDWLVTHQDGSLLKAEDITYGGWRCTPWYLLDASNPNVQEYFTTIICTMRKEWGIELFKLDALFWGALKGCRAQSGITGVEAYRLGMEAINEGVGKALILGCNAPMWPSLGLVDGMRVSNAVERDKTRCIQVAREAFFRSWQHRKLWQIDPDCATLLPLENQTIEQSNLDFHRNVLLACGGFLMSGDPLSQMTPLAKSTLSRLFVRHKHNQNAARFSSLSLEHAYLRMNKKNDLHCLFNFQQQANTVYLTSDVPVNWYDYWSGEKMTDGRTDVLKVSLESMTSRAFITKR
ncbi:glycoside hydrolase family 36 protein [Vibrio hepatarius]|uniref:glycoside hydrolase family 36 protein n=1 Tax=Vibrio hepatarius TaxID=171383 RepID=UPI001C09C080|nr:alpha-galactosidase [Vibrio hepatarius]MBU2895391.1 alpha-galactosidase [Vibrio hepatarius]